MAVCSEGLEAISLIMSGPVLLPGLLLDPEHLRTGATGRQWNQFPGLKARGMIPKWHPHRRMSSSQWQFIVSMSPKSVLFALYLSRRLHKIGGVSHPGSI